MAVGYIDECNHLLYCLLSINIHRLAVGFIRNVFIRHALDRVISCDIWRIGSQDRLRAGSRALVFLESC